jgi:hypothetical protein
MLLYNISAFFKEKKYFCEPNISRKKFKLFKEKVIDFIILNPKNENISNIGKYFFIINRPYVFMIHPKLCMTDIQFLKFVPNH